MAVNSGVRTPNQAFKTYPNGRWHAVRETRAMLNTSLGSGTEFIAMCGTRAVFWEHISYGNRFSDVADCKACAAKTKTRTTK